MYETRNYVIFSVTELDKINFNEVLETSADTVRRSVDGAKTFVKFDGAVPPSLLSLSDKVFLNHEEILQLLSTEEWSNSQIT
jgi:hypothetical protein